MIRQDYLMRLLDQLAQALARVLSLRDNNTPEEALDFLRRESERLIGIEGGLLEVLPPDALRKMTASAEHAIVAARVLEEIALIREEQGQPHEATAAAVKAFALYAAVVHIDPTAADEAYRKRITAFGDACAERGPTPAELRDLMRGYEALGAFARAEDALFALLDSVESPQDYLSEGLDFYERLSEKSDEELAQGGLPRSEIPDGIEELQEKTGATAS